MQVEIKIDPACKEPKIVVLTDKITDEINTLTKKISEDPPQVLSGFQNDALTILDQSNILRLYTSAGKVLLPQTEVNTLSVCDYMSWKLDLINQKLQKKN